MVRPIEREKYQNKMMEVEIHRFENQESVYIIKNGVAYLMFDIDELKALSEILVLLVEEECE